MTFSTTVAHSPDEAEAAGLCSGGNSGYSLASMQLITDTTALGAFCSQLAEDPFVAVDTEFMRERTFWPKLCLVQVAGPSAAAAIDPLAEGIDLAPLLALLTGPTIVKVFHAARQDLEIFYQLIGELPAPVFDTQVAAMVCGFGDQVGYETLAARLARAKLDKASRFTDWSVRPLSQRQIEYALSDVTHLREIYRKLKRKLETSRRSEWLAEEMATLTDPATYRVDPMEAYRRLKTRVGNGRFLAILREVTAWREREAQHRDAPQGLGAARRGADGDRPSCADHHRRARPHPRARAEVRRRPAGRAGAGGGPPRPGAARGRASGRLGKARDAARHRPDRRPAEGAAEAQVRGGGRGPAAGRLRRRPRGPGGAGRGAPRCRRCTAGAGRCSARTRCGCATAGSAWRSGAASSRSSRRRTTVRGEGRGRATLEAGGGH